MSDILDLDALAPKPKRIKINGNVVECFPPTLRQLIRLEQTVNKLNKKEMSDGEAMGSISDALMDMIPAFKDNSEIDLSIPQFFALVQFIQKDAIPTTAAQAQEYPVQKKTDSPEQ